MQKSPAATIADIAKATAACFGKVDYSWEVIGSRHGEKLHETLLTKEEQATGVDLGEYIRVPADQRDLNYAKYFDEGNKHINKLLHEDELNSYNAQQLNVEELKSYLQQTHSMSCSIVESVEIRFSDESAVTGANGFLAKEFNITFEFSRRNRSHPIYASKSNI